MSDTRHAEAIKAYLEVPSDPVTPCTCGSCDWSGPLSELRDIDDCALAAGDPSPAGRCPECDCLAYLDRREDRIIERAERLFHLAQRVVNLTLDSDCPAYSAIQEDARAILREIGA